MVHMAIKIEHRLKRRGNIKPNQSSYTSPWKQSQWKKDEKPAVPKPKTEQKHESSSGGNQAKTAPTTTHNRDIIYWKCQGMSHIATQCTNKRIMTIWENGEYETEDKENSMPPLEDVEVEESPVLGNLLVTRRALNVQAREDKEQRENIFHARCLVQGKVCSMIIAEGNCTNVANKTMVEKLGLPTTKHPRPCKL